MQNLDLAVALNPRTDADRRNGQMLGDQTGQRRWHYLQNQAEGAGLLQRVGVLDELLRLLTLPALDTVSSQVVDGSGSQPNMAHNRDTGFHDSDYGMR